MKGHTMPALKHQPQTIQDKARQRFMTFHDHEQAFTTTCRGTVTLDAIDRYYDGLMLDDCTAVRFTST